MAKDSRGQGSDTRTQALAIALGHAPDAMRVIVQIMQAPKRNSATQLTAAKLVLDVAGIGAEAADRRHQELLEALQGKLSAEAYAEVVRTLAERSGITPERIEPPAEGSGSAN